MDFICLIVLFFFFWSFLTFSPFSSVGPSWSVSYLKAFTINILKTLHDITKGINKHMYSLSRHTIDVEDLVVFVLFVLLGGGRVFRSTCGGRCWDRPRRTPACWSTSAGRWRGRPGWSRRSRRSTSSLGERWSGGERTGKTGSSDAVIFLDWTLQRFYYGYCHITHGK